MINMTWKDYDWEELRKDIEASEPYQDDQNEDQMLKAIYLGRCWNILEDHHNPEEYEEMEEAIPEGMFWFSGEGDPTDLYLGMVVE